MEATEIIGVVSAVIEAVKAAEADGTLAKIESFAETLETEEKTSAAQSLIAELKKLLPAKV